MDLVEALKSGAEPDEIVCGLEDLFLSRQGKVIDNYTVAVILMNKVYKEGPKQDKRLKMGAKDCNGPHSYNNCHVNRLDYEKY